MTNSTQPLAHVRTAPRAIIKPIPQAPYDVMLAISTAVRAVADREIAASRPPRHVPLGRPLSRVDQDERDYEYDEADADVRDHDDRPDLWPAANLGARW